MNSLDSSVVKLRSIVWCMYNVHDVLGFYGQGVENDSTLLHHISLLNLGAEMIITETQIAMTEII